MTGSVWDDFRGHAAVVDGFRRAVDRNRLSSALLLAGGGGREANVRGETRPVPALHTDCGGRTGGLRGLPELRVGRGGDAPGPAPRRPAGGQTRDSPRRVRREKEDRGSSGLCYELSRRPALSGRRVAVIEDADRVNPQAANAFLKTLEEPPPGAVLMLLSDRPDGLLPTIRSRCQTVGSARCPTPTSPHSFRNGGSPRTPPRPTASPGWPGGVWKRPPGWRTRRCGGYGRSSGGTSAGGGPVAAAKAVVAAVEEAGSDAPSQRAAAAWVFAFVADLYRDRLAGLSEQIAEGTASPDAAEPAAAALDRLLEAEAQVARNASVPPILEALVCDLNRG